MEDEELEKLQDLWGKIRGLEDIRWRLMLQLFYKMNANLFDITQHLFSIENYLSTIAKK